MSVEGTYELLFPFSQFEVERILGKLSTGRATSWLSRSKDTGERVVIKEVSLADSVGHEAWVDRQWTGWARIHEIRTGRAAAIYIRDFVEGRPLPRHDGLGDVNAALSLIASVCATLAPLHALSTAHGRLKPANIILDQSGQVVLTDPTFDPSRAASHPDDEDTASASITFDPYYISPEQIREEAATPASDVYSLGCILFEQLSGKAPFRNVAPMMICYQHTMNPPPSLESLGVHVPRDIEALIQRMLAKSRRNRPANVVELLDLIEPLLDPAYAPAAMTGAFTFSPEELQGVSAERQAIEPAPQSTPVAEDLETESDDLESVNLEAPQSPPQVQTDKPASGTMVISRRELKRLIEEADNKKYEPGDTPVLDPDERLPIPLVRAGQPVEQKSEAAPSSRTATPKSVSKSEADSPTTVMPTIKKREPINKPGVPKKSEVEGSGKPVASAPRPGGKDLQTILLIYSLIVTLLFLAALGFIAVMLLR